MDTKNFVNLLTDVNVMAWVAIAFVLGMMIGHFVR